MTAKLESFVALAPSVDLPDGRMLAYGEQAALDPKDEHVARHIEAGRLAKAPEPAPATDPARKKAAELGVDIEAIDGSGKDGNVTVDDVVKAAELAGEASDPEEDDQ